MIAIFAAMDPEVRAAIGWTKATRESEVAGFSVYEIEGGVVCRTGIGPRAKEAAEVTLEAYPAAIALSLGVAGGLSPKIDAGEVVVCDRIDHESHRDSQIEASVTCTPGLVEAAIAAARGMSLPTHVGASITVDQAAWGPEEKAAHHAWKGHDIVEMESYWIGDVAARRRMPFLTVRTISDHYEDSLANTGAMRPDGTFDQDAFLAYVREHPEVQPIITRQYEAGQLAFANLSIFCAAFLPPLVQHFAQ